MTSKLNISTEDGEIIIEGNRAALKDLAGICENLAGLSSEEAKTPSNHIHISADMQNAQKGSLPAIILLNEE